MKLVWDQVGERRYEAGLDRGVLYLPDGSAVPWNGLTSVDEDTSDVEVEAFYFDGFKYLETRSSGDFSGTLKAFTFPEEFDAFDGLEGIFNGAQLSNQPVTDTFSLSYRTRIGNDVNGIDHGYKIHVIYNLMASPDSKSYSSLSDQLNPLEFGWTITAVSELVPGFRPTSHVVFDTTKMNRFLILDIEALLYGKDSVELLPGAAVLDGGTPSSSGEGSVDGGTEIYAGENVIDGNASSSSDADEQSDLPSASLPTLSNLIALVTTWTLIPITDNGDGTWTATGPDELFTFLDSTTFQITGVTAEYLDENTYELSTTHGF